MSAANPLRVLFVTGVSGAGKSSALAALEDLGYEAVDNLPLSLIGRVVLRSDRAPDVTVERPIALGIDCRTRDFDSERVFQVMDDLRDRDDVAASLLFLDCDDEILIRRFEETRRRHPLAADRPVSDGLRRERVLLLPLRERADVVVDSSEMTFGDLKQALEGHYGLETDPGLAVFVVSFAYRRGVPRDADLMFDVRFVKNPHYIDTLRPLTGLDAAVGEYVERDPDFAGFLDGTFGLIRPLLPRYRAEGKSYLTIAVGCTGGRHRSVYAAEQLARRLADDGWRVNVRHRDLEKAAK